MEMTKMFIHSFKRAGKFLSVLLLASSAQFCFAQGKDSRETESAAVAKNAVTLRVGDAAPSLKIDKWVKGESIEVFSKEKFYVVEFWATWCVPCIRSMPHLNELAEQYSKDGLEVIAVTTADESNNLETIKEFVDGRGKEFHFRFGVCESTIMSESFMVAAGQQGIPCSFVIDREGKIAYIGLPSDLDYVLSRIANNTWRGKADLDEIEHMNQSIGNLAELAATDPEKAYAIITHIEKVNPKRATSLDFAYAKALVLCQAKKYHEARSAIETAKPRMIENKDLGGLAMMAAALTSQELNPQGIHRDFAEGLLDELRETASNANDWQALIQIAIGHKFAGNHEEFMLCFESAIAKCPDIQTKIALKVAATQLSAKLEEIENSKSKN